MAPMKSFLLSRWRGEAQLETVFLRDMLLVGTVVTVAALAAAHGLPAAGVPPGLAALAVFLPLPWNIFLYLAVWRSADRDDGPAGLTAKTIGTMWLITMFVLLAGT